MVRKDNYYKDLDLAESASREEIKKAYRKLAKQLHPDINKIDETRMKVINKAHSVLGDINKKKGYDQERAAERKPRTISRGGCSCRRTPVP